MPKMKKDSPDINKSSRTGRKISPNQKLLKIELKLKPIQSKKSQIFQETEFGTAKHRFSELKMYTVTRKQFVSSY